MTLSPSTGAITAGPFTVDAPASGFTDVQQDLAADNPQGSPTSNNLYLVWTKLGSSGSSQVLLSVSGNQGKTWSTPAVVATSATTYNYGATVTAGPNGTIYVAYHGSRATRPRLTAGSSPTVPAGRLWSRSTPLTARTTP